MNPDMTRKQRLSHELMALRVAREFRAGIVVNLGIGLPTLVSNYIPEDGSILTHAENGVVGYGPFPPEGQGDPNLINAGGQMVTLVPGAAFVHHADAFAMIRGGHVDVAVLGALQVSEKGDLANWLMPGRTLGSPGGAVDLVAGVPRVIALMEHTTRDGQPKLVRQCTLPLTGLACVDLVVTDVAVAEVTPQGLLLREVAPGWSAREVQDITEARLLVAPDLQEVRFDREALAPINKVYPRAREAIADVFDGAVIMMDGFGGPGGMSQELILALRDSGVKELTIISNTAGLGGFGTPAGGVAVNHSLLVESGQVSKVVASFPVSASPSRPTAFELAYREGKVELELVPQGTLAERIRAGGAGIAAFYTPTGAGTLAAQDKETRTIDGREYVLEHGLRADFAFIRAHRADTLGNLTYRGTSRNFNAPMATAARVTIAEADEIVQPGEIDPEAVATPSLYVDRIFQRHKKGIYTRT